MKIEAANRQNTKIKMAIQGCSGSGKTYSSLRIAKGLGKGSLQKVGVIDTENGSSNLYAHLGNFKVVKLDNPHNPENYIRAIHLLEKKGAEIIIIDSISHAWEALVSEHATLDGNSFTNWARITPRQNKFIAAILNSNCHIICTMRTKQDYVLNLVNGKHVPEKVGTKPIQRNGVDYEFTIVVNLDQNNTGRITKDRTGLFRGQKPSILTENVGAQLLFWAEADEEE